MKKNILIIDDDELFGEALLQELNDSGLFEASYAQDGKKLLPLEHKNFDLILIDLRLKEDSGLNLIQDIVTIWPKARVCMMTGYGTIATAVSAMKLGATDYITKPVTILKIKELLYGGNKESSLSASNTSLSLDRMEREYIEHILAQEHGNITKAAKRLGLHRQSLQRKLKKWVPNK